MRAALAFRMTAEEFIAWSEGRDERLELIDGVPVMSPSAVPLHQMIAAKLSHFIETYLDEHPLGALTTQCDYWVSTFNYLNPDLAFYTAETLSQLEDPLKHQEGFTPDLIIEILSPSTRKRDLGIKKQLYERSGVREYWVVDPAKRTFRFFLNNGERFRERRVSGGEWTDSEVLPGFRLGFEEFWAAVYQFLKK